MTGSGDAAVCSTGGQVDSIVLALLDAALDKNDSVSHAICNSLHTLGKQQPDLVLSSCHSYLLHHPKLPLAHRVLILNVMEHVCHDTLDKISRAVITSLISQAADEIVNTKHSEEHGEEIIPEWQSAASGILVSLGHQYHNEVMAVLLPKYQPGVLPHFFIVQTLGNLASANPFGMVPYLKELLGITLPMLGMVRQENMKWIFAYTLARFSESIIDYLANMEKAPDPSVRREFFASEISSAFDVLFNSWLHSRESKVRAGVVEAMGHMAPLLSKEKLEENLPKVIPGILGLYRKQQEVYSITQGLCMILDASVQCESSALELQLDAILGTLFPQVCALPDYSQPSGVKNHNEVLRCFAVLTKCYSERIIQFLLQRLENNNERSRIGALTVSKHLINACDQQVTEKMGTIISGLKSVLGDSSNKVKKMLAQVVVAMAHHGHLQLDGGHVLIEFIVRQCALPDDVAGKRPPDPEYVSNEALRLMCENVLHLLTTTVENIDRVLWPHILEYVVLEEMTPAIPCLCKVSYQLGSRKREEQGSDFSLDFEKYENIPKPPYLLARLLVLLGAPLKTSNRGIPILQLMKVISPLIDKSLTALWDTMVPQLLQHLEAMIDDPNLWNPLEWKQSMLNLVSQTLTEIDRERWTMQFANALLSQLPLYSNIPDEKSFLLHILGVVAKKAGNKQFVNQALDTIFGAVNHSNPLEREGCAVAVGHFGTSHLDAVLVKLEQLAKGDHRKGSGFLGFIMDFKGDGDQEKLKATVVLSYGHLTMHAPATILMTRIETPILRNLAHFYQSSKDPCIKQCMLQSVKLIAQALHPGHLHENYVFSSRGELLNQMQSILKMEQSSTNTTIRSLALSAAASLVSLDPPITNQDKTSLIQTSASSVFSLPSVSSLHKLDKDTTANDWSDTTLCLKAGLESNAVFENFNLLMKELLLKQRNPENLEFLFKTLKPWLISRNDFERERCISSMRTLLLHYQSDVEVGCFSTFNTLGSLLGLITPRCTDPCYAVRSFALDCMFNLFLTASKCHSRFSEDNSLLAEFESLKKQAINDDPNTLFALTNELSKIISDKVPAGQLLPFLDALMEGLLDPHSHSSSGCCVILNGVIKLRGGEMKMEVPLIIETLHEKLKISSCQQTLTGMLRAIRSLTHHHLPAVINTLLSALVPLEEHVIETWKVIMQDSELVPNVLELLLEVITETDLTSSQPDPRNRKNTISVVAGKPFASLCALKEVFLVVEVEQHAKILFDRIFTILLLILGSYVGAYIPTSLEGNGHHDSFAKIFGEGRAAKIVPVRCAAEAFRSFLLCVKQDDILSYMADNGQWILLEDEKTYPSAIASLAHSACTYCPFHIPNIVTNLSKTLNSTNSARRVVTIAFFAELLAERFHDDQTLTEPLLNTLLGMLMDPCPVVRKLCLRGLGYIGRLDGEQVHKFSTTVLSAMIAGMDDKDDPDSDITLEAMSGLSCILAQVSEQDVRAILVNIVLRIRPAFDKDKPNVRAAAFTLFGNLSRFGNGPSKEHFAEQVQNNFITMLLHLNDDNKAVVKACKYALRLVGPFLGSDTMNDMFQKHLLDDAALHYGEFINDLTKVIVSDLLEKVPVYISSAVSYLKSSSPAIQCNAALLLGFLLGNLPPEHHAAIAKERACSALVSLLKDHTPEVRIKAADALGMLSSY